MNYNVTVDKNKFLKDYRKYLKDNFNSKRAEKEKAYLYSDLKHYGVSTPKKRRFVNKYKKKFLSLSKPQALSLVKFLWKQSFHEERRMGLYILNLHDDKLTIKDMPLIEKMMRESNGWAFLDNLIIPIMPQILTKNKSAYKYLRKWIRDDDYWVRRSALLAQLLFFRKGSGGDRKLFFEMAESQFDETWIDKIYKDKLQRKRAKFFIRKAIGWTLREMSQKNPNVVFKFLKENKGKMSGLSFREGSRKLPINYRGLKGLGILAFQAQQV